MLYHASVLDDLFGVILFLGFRFCLTTKAVCFRNLSEWLVLSDSVNRRDTF